MSRRVQVAIYPRTLKASKVRNCIPKQAVDASLTGGKKCLHPVRNNLCMVGFVYILLHVFMKVAILKVQNHDWGPRDLPKSSCP